MKRIIMLISISSLMYVLSLHAQPTLQWVTTLEGGNGREDTFFGSAVDENNNIYVCGWIKNCSNEYDLLYAKYNSSGVRQWANTYDNNGDDKARFMVYKSGYIYISGESKSSTDWDMITLKVNASTGAVVWSKRYPTAGESKNQLGGVIRVGSGDTVYIAGTTYASSTDADLEILAYTPSGTLINHKEVGYTSSMDSTKSMIVDSHNNVYVVGVTNGNATGADWSTYKFDNALNQISGWPVRYNGATNGDDIPTQIRLDNSGNPIVTGQSNNGGSTGKDVVIIKYDASTGSSSWTSTYTTSGSNEDFPYAMTVWNDTVYVSAATGTYPTTARDIIILKYSAASGSQYWATQYSNSGDEVAGGILVDGTGNVFASGPTASTIGAQWDLLLLKLNAAGTFQWAQTYNGISGGNDFPYTLSADSANPANLIMVGFTENITLNSSPDNRDGIIIKYQVGGTFPRQSAQFSPERGIREEITKPGEYELQQNFPNPFNPTTTIKYDMKEAGTITLKIYDALGREVKILVDGKYVGEGQHEVNFDASGYGSGVYFYQITAQEANFQKIKKMVMIK